MPSEPTGFCECGCGEKTRVPKYNNTERGYVAGVPLRFIRSHYVERPVEERFWEKVDRRGPDECWEWQAGTDKDGYGRIRLGNDRGQKTVRAHRLSFEMHNGETPPDDMVVCHTCDNPPCVNPAHLWLGTNLDNILDMESKGRRPVGEATGKATLNPDLVRKIRHLYPGSTMEQIARELGVGKQAVYHCLNGRTWRHVK